MLFFWHISTGLHKPLTRPLLVHADLHVKCGTQHTITAAVTQKFPHCCCNYRVVGYVLGHLTEQEPNNQREKKNLNTLLIQSIIITNVFCNLLD